MYLLGQILSAVGGIGSLVCLILLIVKMFQRGQTGLGILFAVLLFCCGIGFLVGLIYGWIKAKDWSIQPLMTAYTVFMVLWVIGNVLAPVDFSQVWQMQR